METRTITQVKVWKLLMNPMTDRTEATQITAMSFDKGKLQQFYNDQKVEPYTDDRWHKQFKQGGPLEWYNPVRDLDEVHWGQGVDWEWAEEANVRNFASRRMIPIIE